MQRSNFVGTGEFQSHSWSSSAATTSVNCDTTSLERVDIDSIKSPKIRAAVFSPDWDGQLDCPKGLKTSNVF